MLATTMVRASAQARAAAVVTPMAVAQALAVPAAAKAITPVLVVAQAPALRQALKAVKAAALAAQRRAVPVQLTQALYQRLAAILPSLSQLPVQLDW